MQRRDFLKATTTVIAGATLGPRTWRAIPLSRPAPRLTDGWFFPSTAIGDTANRLSKADTGGSSTTLHLIAW